MTAVATLASTRAAPRDAASALNNPRVVLGVKNTPRRPRTSTAYSAPDLPRGCSTDLRQWRRDADWAGFSATNHIAAEAFPTKKTGVYTLNRGAFDVARYVMSLFVMSASIKPIVEAGFVMDAAPNARITIFI